MSETTTVIVDEVFTTVVATGTIGPPGVDGADGADGSNGSDGDPGLRGIGGPIFTMEGTLETKIGTLRWRTNGGCTIEGVLAVVGTAPTDDDIIVDVNKNGSTLFSSGKPTIADGDTNSGSISVPSSPNLVDGDEITVDIDQVGSTDPGSDLTVEIFLS